MTAASGEQLSEEAMAAAGYDLHGKSLNSCVSNYEFRGHNRMALS